MREKIPDTRIKVIDHPLEETLNSMDHERALRLLTGRLVMADPDHMAAAQFIDELAEARAKLATYLRQDEVVRKHERKGVIPHRIRKFPPGVISQAMQELRDRLKAAAVK